MKQAFLGAEINKGYIDITVSNEFNIIKKLVYFDIQQSYNEFIEEIKILFESGIEVLHCGFISTIVDENHWVYKISDLNYNIKFHKVTAINVLKELKKITNKNLTPTLICNYLKIHSNDNNNITIQIEEKRKEKIKLDSIKQKITTGHKPIAPKTVKAFSLKKEIIIERNKLLKKQEPKKNKSTIEFFADYNNLILETKENLYSQLKQIIKLTIPEIHSFIKETPNNWLIKILKKYPSQEKISKARIKNIIKLCPKHEKEALEFVAAAKLSIAKENNSKLEYLIKNICENILEFEHKNTKVETYVKRTFKHEYLEKLSKLKLNDRILSVFLIEEIGNINRFETFEDMASNFGIYSEENNKIENKVIFSNYKTILNRLIEKLIIDNSYFSQIYKQKIAQKVSRENALAIVSFKFTKIIYCLLKEPLKKVQTKKTAIETKKTIKQKPFEWAIKQKPKAIEAH